MANELYLKAYIPSVGEYDLCFNKFRAFVSARLSEKAKENGAYQHHPYGSVQLSTGTWIPIAYNTGSYFLRTIRENSYWVYCGSMSGSRQVESSSHDKSGLRIAFQLIYNPKNEIVKNCKTKTQISLVYDIGTPDYYNDKKEGEFTEIVSKAPIVMFGGKECIWLNKEECEGGKDKTMKLWTLELVDCAKPFNKDWSHNDFGQAKELIAQCESALVEGCTKEELNLLVTVKMSKEDGYEKVEPILTANALNQYASNATNTRVIDGRDGK